MPNGPKSFLPPRGMIICWRNQNLEVTVISKPGFMELNDF